MEQVAHQTIVMQFILELAKSLKVDPRACFRQFFTKIKVAAQEPGRVGCGPPRGAGHSPRVHLRLRPVGSEPAISGEGRDVQGPQTGWPPDRI